MIGKKIDEVNKNDRNVDGRSQYKNINSLQIPSIINQNTPRKKIINPDGLNIKRASFIPLYVAFITFVPLLLIVTPIAHLRKRLEIFIKYHPTVCDDGVSF